VRNGKGSFDRVVPLSEIICVMLPNYLKIIRSNFQTEKSKDWLFFADRGAKLNNTSVGKILKYYGEKAKLAETLTCHVWCYSCASHLVKHNANFKHVQELLGHKSLATTERYLHISIEDLKQAHKKFHPRGQ
jgi:site-specific recombinase XerD